MRETCTDVEFFPGPDFPVIGLNTYSKYEKTPSQYLHVQS